MPLSINVGLSRKASQNYQSTGTSINIVAELDSALLAKPEELQQAVDQLYQHAQQALERHSAPPQPPPAQPPAQRAISRYARPVIANANGNGNGQSRNGGTMTDRQRRAILAMSRRVGVDLAAEARNLIGAELDSLTIRQASELIDHLKAMQPVEDGRGGR